MLTGDPHVSWETLVSTKSQNVIIPGYDHIPNKVKVAVNCNDVVLENLKKT